MSNPSMPVAPPTVAVQPTNRPWKAMLAVAFAAIAVGIVASQALVPPQTPVSGPSAEELSTSLIGDSEFIAVDGAALDLDLLTEIGIEGYAGLMSDAYMTWWETPDGSEMVLLLARTGTVNTASKGARFLGVDMSGINGDRIDEPVDGNKAIGPLDEGGEVVVISWNRSDVLAIVLNFGPEEPGDVFTGFVDDKLEAAELSAPWLENPGRVLGRVAGQAIVIILILAGVRFLVRAARPPIRCDPSGAGLDVSHEADQLRWMGRVVATIQGAAIIVMSLAFQIALMWFEHFDIGFFGGPIVAPAITTVVAVVASALFGLVEGRSHNRPPRSLAGQVIALVPIAGGLLLLGVGILLIGMTTGSIASDEELHARVDSELLDVAPTVAVLLTIFIALLTLGLFTAGSGLFRLAAWARQAKPVPGDWGEDTSSATLLLRSFGDDQLRVNSLPSGRRGLILALSARTRDRFEEVLAWELSDFGPLQTVAQPGTSTRAIGAVRTVLSDDTWANEVWKRMHQVPRVVAVMGNTPSLSWEVQALVQANALDKTVFVVPPVPPAEVDARWQMLRTVLMAHVPSLTYLLPPMVKDASAFRVTSSGLWTVAVDRKDEAGYRAAIRGAMLAGPG